MAFYLLLSYLLPSVIQYAFTNAAGGSSWQGRKFQWINGGASTTSTIGRSAADRQSFPTPSHPATYPIEKEINDIKTWELINSLSSIQNENWVEELMDGLVGFLDVCGFTRANPEDEKKDVCHCSIQEKLENELKELDKRLESKEAEMKRVAGGDTSVLKQHYEKKVQDLEHEKRALQIPLIGPNAVAGRTFADDLLIALAAVCFFPNPSSWRHDIWGMDAWIYVDMAGTLNSVPLCGHIAIFAATPLRSAL
ncbi:hypothetical protein L2E82_47214 [Cichorium intybus]|uniref:Uncharacterized protein n=1 Tax=Cichorium intybus TaxID=13427 RepID=A0ACB8YVW7_CICIN|nr:hypothetical protein L2E82_47214 [Cichorium intybus]